MKTITFISKEELLSDTLLNLNPRFQTLLAVLSPQVQERLKNQDRLFFADSYVSRNQTIFQVSQQDPPKSIEELLQWVIIELLGRVNKPYVQCLGQEVKDFKLKMNFLNFGRTIIQTSPSFRTLFVVMPHNQLFNLLLNYIIIVPYKGEHVQVAGRLLNDKYNMKAVGSRRVAYEPPPSGTSTPGGKQEGKIKGGKSSYTKSFTYNNFPLHRFQIFYCSDMNRNPGLFARNIFFDKGLKKSIYIHETERLVRKCMEEQFCSKISLGERQLTLLYPILIDLFESMRELMHVRNYGGKNSSRFGMLLSRCCKLTPEYHKLKYRVLQYVKGDTSIESSSLFDQLYAKFSQYDQVTDLIVEMLRLVVPAELIGAKNKKVLIQMMASFISMKRFQNYKMEDFLLKMNAFQPEWFNCAYNPKYHRKIITRRRKLLALTVGWIVNELVVPVIKLNFYVTEKHKEANRIFYYRKPIWTLISKAALKRFSEENLEQVDRAQLQSIRKNVMEIYPQGKLRILPKKGSFRPIITFNRKMDVPSENNTKTRLRANLNQILVDTQLVLRNLKNILGEKMGYCIFDNRQISRRYDDFVLKWRQAGQPPLKYFTVDIHKCYDSIDTSRLLRFIEESPLIDDLYLVIKYNRLYRNKKALFGTNQFTSFFNYKERVAAIPLKDDPMQLKEEHHVPAVNIFPCKQRLITKEAIIDKLRRICSGSIVNYRKLSWQQKLGIPQGLNVSGVLCSLYFACLEDQYVKVKEGLLMRLTDDYFYIGPEREASKVLDSLLHCAEKNGFRFSEDKVSKNFEHPISPRVNESKEIVWIGKRINIETLQMMPNFQMNQKVGYAMNVNLDRSKLKRFLKNKLKSLLTNHFAAYFKPSLFQYPHLAASARLYMRMSLEKFYPFLQEVKRLALPNTIELILKVLKACLHEFLIFACTLGEKLKNQAFYYRLYTDVSQEIVSFFKRKASEKDFLVIGRIFKQQSQRIQRVRQTL